MEIMNVEFKHIRDGMREDDKKDKIWVCFDAKVQKRCVDENGELVVIYTSQNDSYSSANYYGPSGEREEVSLSEEELMLVLDCIEENLKKLSVLYVDFNTYKNDLELRKNPLYGLLVHDDVIDWTEQFVSSYSEDFFGIEPNKILDKMKNCSGLANGKIILSHISRRYDEESESYIPHGELRIYREDDIDIEKLRNLLTDTKIEDMTDEELDKIISAEIAYEILDDLEFEDILHCRCDFNNLIEQRTAMPFFQRIITSLFLKRLPDDKLFNSGDERRDKEDKCANVLMASLVLYRYLQI